MAVVEVYKPELYLFKKQHLSEIKAFTMETIYNVMKQIFLICILDEVRDTCSSIPEGIIMFT